jgi:hypothetical protein
MTDEPAKTGTDAEDKRHPWQIQRDAARASSAGDQAVQVAQSGIVSRAAEDLRREAKHRVQKQLAEDWMGRRGAEHKVISRPLGHTSVAENLSAAARGRHQTRRNRAWGTAFHLRRRRRACGIARSDLLREAGPLFKRELAKKR